ncbi:putative disease resistance protein RGA1 isoform X2 [Papaver somniferum]|uniref:putative disease resistance protein RGA1 isoform X2 n=1 Tax=Papaver somniferum TaxID=3469 RepID=UPI000E6FD53D|nr:putative disease resistance protein RGA1 isoform X2 [Papaver somniferum]
MDSRLWKRLDSEMFNRTYESTSNSFNEVIFGRESVIEELLAKVEDVASQEISGISVISVVGITGIGKTTIAQSLSRDPKIMKKYVRVWFSMHQDFHLDGILKSIIESLSGEKYEVLNSGRLHAEFTRQIRARCIFLVLDNARHDLRKDWSDILSFLRCAAKGSVVLVTTLSPMVSSIIGSQFKYELPKLSEEDCWSVFQQTAFPSQDYAVNHPELCCIGEKIVKRCYGLPLIASTLGHLLFGQNDIKEWECILNTDLWNLPVDMNAVTHYLRSCYHQLPKHLKILVPYCGLLSRKFQFEKEMLVQLWMAEELIQPKGNMQLEDLGNSYFDDLVKRGFFLPSSADEDGLKFVVHGFIHDMVQLVNVDGSFRLIINEKSDLLRKTDFVRHVSMDMDGLQLRDLEDFKRLRTILLLSGGGSIKYLYPSRMVFVRVLDLSHSLIGGVPSTISLLSQLRYLNVSYTLIRFIDKEVYAIRTLQTMKLRGCASLTRLPVGIGICENLRHLDLDESSQIATPLDIGLEFVDTRDARYGCVNEKGNLKRLKLQWASTQNIDERITQFLQPHCNLRELVIQGYPLQEWGRREWIWSSPSCLQNIELVGCDNLRSISILRDLPFLKTLTLQGNKSVENFDVQNFFVFEEPHNGFESLEVLLFVSWTRWTAWTVLEECHMPKLGKLSIKECALLTTVPDFSCLPLLKELELVQCNSLRYSVGREHPLQLALRTHL